MAINVIVGAVTLMMGGFVAIWIVYPRSRVWFEAPKWQPLGWDQSPRAPEDRAITQNTISSEPNELECGTSKSRDDLHFAEGGERG